MVVLILISAFTLTAFAEKRSYSFNVHQDINLGIAYSAPNPKDDNEQIAYIYTQNHNFKLTDIFYFAVRGGPSPD